MDHYNKGGDLNDPFLDPDMRPLALKEADINDLVAFLVSLTSPDYRKPALKELARRKRAAARRVAAGGKLRKKSKKRA